MPPSTSTSSGPSRTGGWGPRNGEPGSAFRGIGRGRGRGGRGGHHGGKSGSSRGGPAASTDAGNGKKPPPGPKKTSPKAPAPASSSTPAEPAPAQPSASSKHSRPRPSRKASESKASRKPSLSVDPAASAPATPNANGSNANLTSPHTPARRKRSHTHNREKSHHPTNSSVLNVPNLPRKPSLTAPAEVNTARSNGGSKAKAASPTAPTAGSVPASAPSKDLPPHLAAQSVNPQSDIKHDIDALVERVRAGAMDSMRPHTPGSHIDWAGEEDDSLPDLDDWGVTSSTATTTTTTTDSSKGHLDAIAPNANVISPILQDALKPLPSMHIVDGDVTTPSIKLHEVSEKERDLSIGDRTPRRDADTDADTLSTGGVDGDVSDMSASVDGRSVPSPSLQAVTPTTHTSAVESPAVNGKSKTTSESPAVSSNTPAKKPLVSPKAVRAELSDLLSHTSVPSPSRSLTASIHALSPSPSSNGLLSPPPRVPSRGGTFSPSHARAQTVGRYGQDNYLSDSERIPRPNHPFAHGHGRNHSTPPAGSAGGGAHTRTSSRPVISGDAISKLARTLGGAPLRKRETMTSPPAATAAKVT